MIALRNIAKRYRMGDEEVMALAGVTASRSREQIFAGVCELAQVNLLALRSVGEGVLPSRSAIPYMNEPWYC